MTPDAAERRARALLDGSTPGEWAHYYDEDAGHPCVEASARSDHRSRWIVAEVRSESMANAALIAAAPELARDVLSLADALRAAEARAVAAEADRDTYRTDAHRLAAANGRLLDEADAAQRGRRAAEAQRDTADARHAALAGAVESVRAAVATVAAAGARYGAAWDAVDAMPPTASQSEGIAEALRVSYEAQEVLGAAVDALLRGAPGGCVPARVVASYKAAVERIADLDDDSPESVAAFRAARTALEAALAAAGCP